MPFDAAAGSWLAGVTGDPEAERRERAIDATGRVPAYASAPPSVGEVAFAVDAGRDLAAHAAADGVNVLVGSGGGDPATLARWLAGEVRDERIRGPLGALRRLADAETAFLVGLALGAGERGLGFVCDGPAAVAAARVAIASEPDLEPRVRLAL